MKSKLYTQDILLWGEIFSRVAITRGISECVLGWSFIALAGQSAEISIIGPTTPYKEKGPLMERGGAFKKKG